MAYESPLFQSSLDLFAHSIEHFNSGTERDRKFVILHLANSVELIFKDLLLDLGESIYKNPKETISIAGAISTLTKEKGINIPHLNKLELLIDERNSLQHRYGFPNELTTIFYMEATHSFFRDFLKSNYALEIDDVLTEFISDEDLAAFQLRTVSNIHELDKLIKLTKVHPVGALLSAYAYLEKQLLEIIMIIQDNSEHIPARERRHLTGRITTPDFLPKMFQTYEVDFTGKEERTIRELRMIRNQAAHGRDEPEQKKVSELIKFIKSIEPLLEELTNKVKDNPTKLFE
ncbi:MAG: hypothetical protein DHS20C18_53830 [Saprospiraceae bacterium]|nr:MAG: hypothetical protein DHS20C18_53830 [Saprospiraceae bacterium]